MLAVIVIQRVRQPQDCRQSAHLIAGTHIAKETGYTAAFLLSSFVMLLAVLVVRSAWGVWRALQGHDLHDAGIPAS